MPAGLDVHADAAFGARERRAIAQGTADVLRDTGGRLEVRVRYDLDMTKDLRPYLAARLLLRAPASAPIVQIADGHGHVLGLTVDGRRAYLVTERLADDDRFARVAEHEILHLAGLQHTDRGVMALNAGPAWTTSDEIEFERVSGEWR